MAKPARPVDLVNLRKLWPWALTDKELEQRLGHCRGSFRRAAGYIGLPPRKKARAMAFEAGEKRT